MTMSRMKQLALVLILLSFIVALLGYYTEAFAQDATEPSSLVNLGVVLQPILMTLGSAAAAVLTAILYKVLANIGISLDQQTQGIINGALDKSINFGVNKAREKFLDGLSVDVKSVAIADAINYFKQHWPDTQKRLGWSDEDIRRVIFANLGPGEMETLELMSNESSSKDI